MITLTKNQLDILRHTAKNRWFATTSDCQDGKDCDAMTEAGLMHKSNAPRFWGDDYVYVLTNAGKEAIK